MKKSIENLHTSKITGGRRHVLRSRRKYEIDRFPNEALIGDQITIKEKFVEKISRHQLKQLILLILQ